MGKNNTLATTECPTGGRFIDVDDVLLSLFADPDSRGDRRWREVFGHARRSPFRVKSSFLATAMRADAVRVLPSDL